MEDSTRARDEVEVDTGAVVAAALAAEASSVDVDAAVVTSGVAAVASAVLPAAERPPLLRRALLRHFPLCRPGVSRGRHAEPPCFGLAQPAFLHPT